LGHRICFDLLTVIRDFASNRDYFRREKEVFIEQILKKNIKRENQN